MNLIKQKKLHDFSMVLGLGLWLVLYILQHASDHLPVHLCVHTYVTLLESLSLLAQVTACALSHVILAVEVDIQ